MSKIGDLLEGEKTKGKFFSFIKPYLSFIDSGAFFKRPFYVLYTVIAAVNLILPVYIMYEAIDNRIFEMPAKFFIVFFLVWLFVAAASWVGFQIWWDRKSHVMGLAADSTFAATNVFAYFIQTAGEWLGSFIAIVGVGTALIATVILGREAAYLGSMMPGLGSITEFGIAAVFVMPVVGFIIIVLARFFAEQIRALCAIAINTKK